MNDTAAREAEAFVAVWSQVWRGADSDPDRYMELLHDDCHWINPLGEGTRADLPAIMATFLQLEPDIRVEPICWAATDDGVLIEWVNRGTLRGTPIEVYGMERFTFKDGKAIDGRSYFDPRPFLAART